MKNSKIVLISGAAALALLIVFSLVFIKLSLSRDISYSRSEDIQLSGETAEIPVDTSGITRISLTGVWKIDISGSTDTGGTVSVPREYHDKVVTTRKGNLLSIGLDKSMTTAPVGGFSVALPLLNLEELSIDGAADGVLKDIEADKLNFRLHGAVNLSGHGLKADRFTVVSDGAGNLDMSGSLFTNVELQMKGASNVELHLEGGLLEGNIEGIGSVSYTGNGENRLKTEGIVSISAD